MRNQHPIHIQPHSSAHQHRGRKCKFLRVSHASNVATLEPSQINRIQCNLAGDLHIIFRAGALARGIMVNASGYPSLVEWRT